MSLWTKSGQQVSGFPQRQTPPAFGQAQPVQPQSQGTPYGQPPRAAPAPQQANFSSYRPQQVPASPFTQYNPQQIGNFVQQQMGLPSFQFNATDSFGNTYDNPAALAAQQGAMAQALNAQRAQQIQSGNFGQLNPMAAYQQAQNMVQGGWTNPFAAQPVAPPSQGTPYGGGNNPSVLESPTPLPGAAQPPRQDNQFRVLGYPSYLDDIKRKQYEQYLREQGPAPVRALEQAQPVQPPSQAGFGSGMLSPPSPPPQSQAAPPRSYADERRAQDQAAYEELMQQIRRGGGSMADNMRADRRRADLERRLGMTQAPAQPGAAQPIQPPSQGTQYGQPVLRAHEDPMNPTGPNYTPPPRQRPGQPATLMVGEYGQPPAQMPVRPLPRPPSQMPAYPEITTLAAGEESNNPQRPPQGPANPTRPMPQPIRSLPGQMYAEPADKTRDFLRYQAQKENLHGAAMDEMFNKLTEWARPKESAAQQAEKRRQERAWQAAKHADWMAETAGYQKSASPNLKWIR